MESQETPVRNSNGTVCSMALLLDELRKLRQSEIANMEHDCTAESVMVAICSLLDEVVLKDDSECVKLEEFERDFRVVLCKLIGEHRWVHDHCGYWGHQYCVNCHQSKYPELSSLGCGDAIAKTGKIREDEYHPSP